VAGAKPVFTRLFQEYGLPKRIRSGNGVPDVYFGPLKLGRLHERRMRIEDEYGRLSRHRDV
jgi:hypothetical protein